MSNPLIEIKNLLSKKSKVFTGEVVSKNGTFLKVRTDNGGLIDVTGDFRLGSYVFVKDNVVLGIVKRQEINTVYVG